jgi:hypothetical protein
MKLQREAMLTFAVLSFRGASLQAFTVTLWGLFLLVQIACISAAFGQVDDFDRADSAALGNGWVEKSAAAFSLVGNQVRKAATSTGYADNLVYRPTTEALLDGEASVEVRFQSLPPGYPQLFVRAQPATIANAGAYDGYLLFIDNATNRALLDRIENGAFFVLAQITLASPLNTTDTFRLRLRATGTQPVRLEAYVERRNGTNWDVIGQATVDDNAPSRLTTPGTVGFSAHVEGNLYTYDNFTRLPLDNSEPPAPAPVLADIEPASAAAGSEGFTLVVSGSDFSADSVVRWNGEERPTTFVTATELRADIPETDIAIAGTAAVTVFTPGPGGGSSNSASFFSLTPDMGFFFDDFNRQNSATLGNGWTEKFPAAFSIQNGEIISIDTYPIDYHDTIVYRPLSEDRRDVEVGIEFRLLPGLNFPQVHARVQRDSLTQPDTLESYIFFVDGFEPSPGRAMIAVQPPVTDRYECYMLGIPFPSPLQQTARYRLRFRVSGVDPVVLTGFVDRFDGQRWQVFASGTITHTTTTQRDPSLYCDFGVMPPPITEVGTVGFAKWTTNNEVLDNFYWMGLAASNPVPFIDSLSPEAAQAGGGAFTLTVSGAGFVENSVVRWNGENRPTTRVSSTQLGADIPATDIAVTGAAEVTVFTPAPGGGVSNMEPFSITADDPQIETTVTFDDPVPPGASGDLLTGVFEGIDFGTGRWRWEGAFGVNATNHIFFDSGVGTSRTLQFSPAPRRLASLRVFTGIPGNLTLSDDLGQQISLNLNPGVLQVIQTGWAQRSTTVTVNFTGGWELGIDDIVHAE